MALIAKSPEYGSLYVADDQNTSIIVCELAKTCLMSQLSRHGVRCLHAMFLDSCLFLDDVICFYCLSITSRVLYGKVSSGARWWQMIISI